MKRKIAFVGNSALTMINFRMGVMRELAKEHEVVMIAPEDCALTPLKGTHIRFVPIHIDCKGTNPIHDMRLYRELKAIYSREQFDFIYHFTIKPVIYGSLAAGALRIRHISVVTGLGYTFIKRNWLFRVSCLLHRVALRKAVQVWFLNQDDHDCFVSLHLVHPDKAHVIPGEGVDTDYYISKHPMPEKFTFIYIGRMLRYKGVELYVQAAERLRGDYPDVCWQLLGPYDMNDPDGITPNEMEQWVQKGWVEYLGVSKDVRPVIEQCSCSVLASYFREGVPRSLMEAASMERPIITTDSVGCRDVVENGVNGLLCQPNSVESLEETMRQMLEMTAEQRIEMGKRGRERMQQKFDLKKIIEEYQNSLNTAC